MLLVVVCRSRLGRIRCCFGGCSVCHGLTIWFAVAMSFSFGLPPWTCGRTVMVRRKTRVVPKRDHRNTNNNRDNKGRAFREHDYTPCLVSVRFDCVTYPPTDRSIDWLDKKDHGLHIINRGECGLTTTKGMVELPRKCSCESCVAHARLLCSLRGKRATQRQTMTHQLIAVTVGIHPSICLFA